MVTIHFNPIEPGASWSPSGEPLTIFEAGEPSLAVDDSAASLGDGIFESILLHNGNILDFIGHIRRLGSSAELTELPTPYIPQWRQAVLEAVALTPVKGDFVIRTVLSRGIRGGRANAWVSVRPAPDHTQARKIGVKLHTLSRGTTLEFAEQNSWLSLGAKTLSYSSNMAALRQAKAQGADDVLFTSSDGFALEGATANIIVKFREGYQTPRPGNALLHGTTQQRLFSEAGLRGVSHSYQNIKVAEIPNAEAAWLVSSIRLAVPITAIDDQKIAVDHELTDHFNKYLLEPSESDEDSVGFE